MVFLGKVLDFFFIFSQNPQKVMEIYEKNWRKKLENDSNNAYISKSTPQTCIINNFEIIPIQNKLKRPKRFI